jgi:hypothetical protein
MITISFFHDLKDIIKAKKLIQEKKIYDSLEIYKRIKTFKPFVPYFLSLSKEKKELKSLIDSKIKENIAGEENFNTEYIKVLIQSFNKIYKELKTNERGRFLEKLKTKITENIDNNFFILYCYIVLFKLMKREKYGKILKQNNVKNNVKDMLQEVITTKIQTIKESPEYKKRLEESLKILYVTIESFKEMSLFFHIKDRGIIKKQILEVIKKGINLHFNKKNSDSVIIINNLKTLHWVYFLMLKVLTEEEKDEVVDLIKKVID